MTFGFGSAFPPADLAIGVTSATTTALLDIFSKIVWLMSAIPAVAFVS